MHIHLFRLYMDSNTLEYDIAIIGGGPAGLAASIKLAQLATQYKIPMTIAVLEKGSEVGAHSISGAVFETRALDELLPDWKTRGAPLNVPATEDHFYYLMHHHALRLPTPPPMRNHGNYIISLGKLCKFLAQVAEGLGVDIFPGFAVTKALFNENGRVVGVITGDKGIGKNGEKKSNFQPGVEIKAKYILVAEGARGSLTKQLVEHFSLRKNSEPQTYGIGIKEIWEIDPKKHTPGKVVHTIGWPLDHHTYGGSFIYHGEPSHISIGFVVGLDYTNPYLDPFEEFQRFKLHPAIKPLLEDGKRIGYGARAINEGGLQSIPTLSFPGGLLIGCAAGFLNVPKIKGNHTAMKSGMLAAEAVFEALQAGIKAPDNITNYRTKLEQSWVWKELKQVRNIRPAFQWGLWPGLVYSAIDNILLRSKTPWTLHHKMADHLCLKPAAKCNKINYPKPDNQITFDKLTSVALSGTNHKEDQPCHLTLKNSKIPITTNLPLYDAPEQRYCPAAVYEVLKDLKTNQPYLQINAQNCVHCKTCDIKDPTQNINWIPPEGGDGPNYGEM